MLEVASELVDQPEWRYRQARISLREQGGDGWPIALFGSDSPAAIAQVAERRSPGSDDQSRRPARSRLAR